MICWRRKSRKRRQLKPNETKAKPLREPPKKPPKQLQRAHRREPYRPCPLLRRVKRLKLNVEHKRRKARPKQIKDAPFKPRKLWEKKKVNELFAEGLKQVMPLGNRKRQPLKQFDQKLKPPLHHQLHNPLHKSVLKQLLQRAQPSVLRKNEFPLHKCQKLAPLLRPHPAPRRLRHKKLPKLVAPKQHRAAAPPFHNKRHLKQVPVKQRKRVKPVKKRQKRKK